MNILLDSLATFLLLSIMVVPLMMIKQTDLMIGGESGIDWRKVVLYAMTGFILWRIWA